MKEISNEPRLWLEAEYLARREKNPSYSLRAFSRLLDIPSGRISQLLSKKRRFTPKLGKKIAFRLNYDPVATQKLLECIERSRGKVKALEDGSEATVTSAKNYAMLDMDKFQSIADPIHFAILSLIETTNFRSEIKSIASRLGISTAEARSAIARLERVGLIEITHNGRIKLTNSPGLTTSHDIQSSAIREAHRKALQHALDSLETVSVDLRDITLMTMAIDPKKLPAAKEKIKAFRRSLSDLLETGQRTEVYRLNIQLVPITKEGKKQ